MDAGKMVQIDPLQGSRGDVDTENRLVDTVWEGEGWMN